MLLSIGSLCWLFLIPLYSINYTLPIYPQRVTPIKHLWPQQQPTTAHPVDACLPTVSKFSLLSDSSPPFTLLIVQRPASRWTSEYEGVGVEGGQLSVLLSTLSWTITGAHRRFLLYPTWLHGLQWLGFAGGGWWCCWKRQSDSHLKCPIYRL